MTPLLAILLVGPFMAQADATIANVATPSIRADLGASAGAAEMVIGGYLTAFAVLLITGARLGQTHGYSRVFLVAIAAFGTTSLICGLAPDATVLVAARVAQGASAALMFPQALTGIQLNFDGRARVRAIGLYAAALSAGAVVGQLVGGVLVAADLAGSQWRSTFLINVPVAAVAIAAGLRHLPADERRTSRPLDKPGVVALTIAALLVVLPLAIGRAEGWPLWTWLCLVAAAPATALFLATQWRATSPLVSVRVLATPAVGWALLAQLIATGTYYALLFTLAQYFQQGLGHSALVSGLVLVPWVAAFGVAGQIVQRLPTRRLGLAPAAGCLLLTAAYAAISVSMVAGPREPAFLVALLAVGGLGLGVYFSAILAHLSTAVPPGHAEDISGVSSTTAAMGGALGVAVFGTLYFSFPHVGPHEAKHAFAAVTAAYAVAALTALFAAWRATAPSRRSFLPAKHGV